MGIDEGMRVFDVTVNTGGLSVVVKATLHAKERIYLFSFLK